MSESPGGNPALQARLHGTALLLKPDGEPVALERKHALLLAYLWLEGQTPRGQLARLLWPDAPDARARGNLRQRLAVLRQAAGAELVVDAGGVLSLAPMLQVEPAGAAGEALLARFEYDDCGDAARWLDAQRESQRTKQRAAMLGAIRAAVQGGQLDQAMHLADALLATDRESEEAYRAQMEVLYLRGDTAAAIAVWDRCKDMLRQLYGVAPSPATRQLGETILAASRAALGEGTVPAPGDAIPVTVLRPPRLIARQASLQQLVAAWRSGATPWLCGEAGVGKSRLLAEFAATAGPCALAVARPGDADVPYASLERLVLAAIDRFEPGPALDDDLREAARLLPRLAEMRPGEIPAAVQTDHERRQCLRAVSRLLASCTSQGCAAMLLDDLHFADTASVEAVIDMAGQASPPAEPAPLRFVFGTRWDEAAARGAPWLASLGDAARFRRIDLAPLDAAGVGELVESLGLAGLDTAALARRLWPQVGGNPAFVLESVKLLLSLGSGAVTREGALPLAPDIVTVIEQRVALLSPQARHLAQLAAIAGQSFTVPLAAAALACAPLALSEPLRELELRQVLYGRRFVHDVIAVGVERTVPRSVAEFMHRFVAEYLEQHHGQPAHVATHWQAAGEPQRAGEAYRQAAHAAGEASRPREQSALLDAAAACFEQCGAVDALFDVLEERQAVHLAPDAMVARQTCMDRMAAIAATEEQRLRLLLCRHEWDADRSNTDALDIGLAAIDRAVALGMPRTAFEFARATAWRLALRGDEADAIRTLEAHREWVMAHGRPADRGDFHGAMAGVLGFVDRLAPAVEASRRAVAELRAESLWAKLLPVLSNLGLLLHWLGQLAEAEEALREARQLRDRMHGQGSGLVIDLNLGAVQRDLGEYVEADRTLAAALAELRVRAEVDGDMRTDCVLAENHHAQMWLSLGQPARALEAMRTDDAAIAVRFRARRVALRLRAARMLGRGPADLLAQAEAMSEAIESPFHRSLLDLETARGRPAAEAVAVFEQVLLLGVTRERPGLMLHAAARAANAALALGELARVRPSLDAMRPLLETCAPYDVDRAELWLMAAAVLESSGEAAVAEALIEHGVQWLRATAAQLPEEWRDAFLRRHPANASLLARAAA
ncbi:MAG: AAA family ATPase [Burkholderiales bacterium]|nr:AAA family ATPase [Burkholderiales bacterium]